MPEIFLRQHKQVQAVGQHGRLEVIPVHVKAARGRRRRRIREHQDWGARTGLANITEGRAVPMDDEFESPELRVLNVRTLEAVDEENLLSVRPKLATGCLRAWIETGYGGVYDQRQESRPRGVRGSPGRLLSSASSVEPIMATLSRL